MELVHSASRVGDVLGMLVYSCVFVANVTFSGHHVAGVDDSIMDTFSCL